MGILKILINGIWTPIGGQTTTTYGTTYVCAIVDVTQDQQTQFTIPMHAGADKTFVIFNGIHYTYPQDYGLIDTTLTWNDDMLEQGEILYFYHIPEE